LTVSSVGAGTAIDPTSTTCASTLPGGDACVVAVKRTAATTGVLDAYVDLRAAGGRDDPLRVPIVGQISRLERIFEMRGLAR
jgi:hypothetical protein